MIVTANVRHFADLPEDIEAQSADQFLCNLFDLDPDGFIELLREQARDLKNRPITFSELLDRLARAVPDLASAVRSHLEPR